MNIYFRHWFIIQYCVIYFVAQIPTSFSSMEWTWMGLAGGVQICGSYRVLSYSFSYGWVVSVKTTVDREQKKQKLFGYLENWKERGGKEIV